MCFSALFQYNYKLKYALFKKHTVRLKKRTEVQIISLFKKYSDFLYKIQDSGLSVYAVLLDVRMKSGAKLYIYF